MDQEIKERYENIVRRISAAARSVGRNPNTVRLMVVTKAHDLDVIQSAIVSGAKLLGENYVEEAIPKIAAVKVSNVEWHMIGHIQSRKAKQVCLNFPWVHSVDRLKIAARLSKYAGEVGKELSILLECNVSGEGSKFGYQVWNESQWPQMCEEVSRLLALPHLMIRGLMTIPPWDPDPETSRPFYQRLRRLQEYLVGKFPEIEWGELSMGMSNDFEIAVQEGATMVRVGTAILGPRK